MMVGIGRGGGRGLYHAFCTLFLFRMHTNGEALHMCLTAKGFPMGELLMRT